MNQRVGGGTDVAEDFVAFENRVKPKLKMKSKFGNVPCFYFGSASMYYRSKSVSGYSSFSFGILMELKKSVSGN
jgi:hypothetical protein